MARQAPRPDAFVRSMEGTRPDGQLTQGSAGQLVVDAELGHLFDYYLAGLGEKDLRAISAEIGRELDRRLAPAPAAEAKRLLARYLDYKRALAGAEQSLAPASDPLKSARARQALLLQLRPGFFSASEIAGLFGDSDAYDADALARMVVLQDAALDPSQQAARLAALDQKLTPAMRADRDAPTQVIRLEELAQGLRAQGAGDDAIYRLRAQALSPDAAARLAEVDREEAAWTGRIQAYLAQRARLPADVAAQHKQQLQQQLRDQHFNAQEQRRLGAYE